MRWRIDTSAPCFALATRFAPLLGAAASLLGCGEPDLPLLAIIDQVEPDAVEPNDTIRILGSGFVEGPIEARFQGTCNPSGLTGPRRAALRLGGRAISETRIELPVSALTLERMTREPCRFEGSVEVAFPAAERLGALRIVARLDRVAFDVQPTGGGVVLAAQRARKASGFLGSLGIAVSDAHGADDLLIAAVRPGSPAHRAGAGAGDRLLAVDGTALVSLADLDGIDRAGRHRFDLLSPSGVLKELSLSALPRADLESDEFAAILLSSAALGLFLAFAGPGRGRPALDWSDSENPLLRAIALGAVSIPLLLMPAGAILVRAGLGALALLAGLHLLGLSAATLLGAGRLSARLGSLGGHLWVVPTAVGVASISGSAIGPWDAVASQGAAPWGWHVWSSPFTLAAVIAALSLLWPAMPPSGTRPALHGVARWFAAIPAAAIVCAFCLGGWLVPGVPVERMGSSGGLLALGSLIFFAKTWLVLLAARWFASAGLPERRALRAGRQPLWPRVVLLLIALLLSLAWVWADLPESSRITGRILATAAFVTFFTALATAGLKRAAPHPDLSR